MRAFLVLFFSFSLCIGTFDQWLSALEGNILDPQFDLIDSEKHPKKGTTIHFFMQVKARPGTWLANNRGAYLKAELTYNQGLAQCQFVPVENWRHRAMEDLKSLKRSKVEMIQKEIKEQSQGHAMKQTLEDIDRQIELLKKSEFDLRVMFYFRTDDNSGEVEWVGAGSKYLFHGENLPKKGFGSIAMENVMELYDVWMNPAKDGIVTVEDASEKYVGGPILELRALSIEQ